MFDQLSQSICLKTLLAIVAMLLAAGPADAQHPTPLTSILDGASTPDTALEVNHNGSLLMPGTFNPTAPTDSIPATGAGTRMMWYPAKAAFRAGRVGMAEDGTQWDASSVGDYSVAFGVDTEATRFAATAMGTRTTASDAHATAMGRLTTASEFAATAMGARTTASGNEATAMGFGTKAATGKSLSIGECNNANSGGSGDGTLFVAGNGTYSSGSCSNSDALVLKKDGDLAVGPSDPGDLRLHLQKDKSNKGVGDNPGGNIVLFENTDTGTKPDVMGLQAGPSSPGAGVTYVSFYNRSGTTLGQIRGDGSGGVNYVSSSADFAEELPVAAGAEVPEAGDLVGVRGGTVSLEADGADRVMIVSEAPAMTGNATPSTDAEDERRVPVAFIGQVPAKVRGEADIGDLIVPSGRNDGTARAVAPDDYRRSEHGPIAGQAWTSKSTSEVGEVTVAVGLGRTGAAAEQLREQRSRIRALEAENENIKKRLAALEARQKGPAIAGLFGSWGLALLLGLGGLAGGLLWRRRS